MKDSFTHFLSVILLVFLGIIPLFIACDGYSSHHKDNKKYDDSFALSRSKTIRFKTDSVTPSTTFCLQYCLTDSSALLAFQNRGLNELIIFDMNQKRQIHKLKFEEEGPEGVGKMSSFFIYGRDSILVVSRNQTKIRYFNWNGQQIHEIKFKKGKEDRLLFASVMNHFRPPIALNDTINLAVFPVGNWSIIKDFSNQPVAALVDTRTGKYSFSEVTYPKDYYEDGILDPVFSRARGKDQVVYSFVGDHKVYSTENHVTFSVHEAESKFFREFKFFDQNPDLDEYLRQAVGSSLYLGMLYDPFREVFYRFVSLGKDITPQDNLRRLSRFPPNLSVVILDDDLNRLGEIKLPTKKYYWKNAFVAEEGLYISSNSPYNDDVKSEGLNFDLFELHEMQ